MNRRIFHSLAAAACLFLALAGQSQIALAQSESATIEEIVVTARKRAESIQDVPISVTAVSGEYMEKMNISNIQDIAPLAPNLDTTYNVGFQNFYIRGIGSNVTIPGYENAVATYIDGLYVARPAAANMHLPNIERIEILRGPQGTLFGKNAIGGLINIITKGPTEEFEGSASISAANEETWEGKFFVSGGLADNLFASISVAGRDQGEGYGKNLSTGNDVYHTDYLSARIRIVYQPSDDFEIELAPYYNEVESSTAALNGIPKGAIPATANGGILQDGTPVGPASFTTKPRDVYWTDDPFYRFEEQGVGLTITKEWKNVELVAITNYNEADAFIAGDFDTTEAHGWGVAFVPGGIDVSNPTQNFLSSYDFPDFLSQEIRLTSTGDGPLQWVAGVYYQDSTDCYCPVGVFQDTAPAGWSDQARLDRPEFSTIIVGSQDTKALGVFAQLSYDVTDRLNLTVGARHNDEEKDGDIAILVNLARPTGSNLFEAISVQKSEEWKTPTYHLSATYELEDAMVYASFNTGFKSGGFNVASPSRPGPVDEELVDAWEIGFKSDLLDGRLRLNGNVFYWEGDDMQFLSISATTGTAILQNAAEADAKGLELEVTYLASDNLTLFANFGWIDSEYTSFPNFVGRSPQVDAAGNLLGGTSNIPINVEGEPLVKTPKHTLNVGLFYERALSDGMILQFNLDASHKGDAYSEIEHTDALKQDAFAVANASIGLIFPRDDRTYRVTAWSRNITDEDALVGGSSVFNTQRARYNEPRTYGIRFGVDF